MKSKSQELFGEAYADARRLAAAETGMALQTLPADLPFDLDDLRGLRADVTPKEPIDDE